MSSSLASTAALLEFLPPTRLTSHLLLQNLCPWGTHTKQEGLRTLHLLGTTSKKKKMVSLSKLCTTMESCIIESVKGTMSDDLYSILPRNPSEKITFRHCSLSSKFHPHGKFSKPIFFSLSPLLSLYLSPFPVCCWLSLAPLIPS